MSKRGSKNAKKFAGKFWNVLQNIIPSQNGDKKQIRKSKLIEKRNKLIRKQFDSICKSFHFKTVQYPKKSEELYKYFDEHYTRVKRSNAVSNVNYYKLHCEIKNKEHNIEEYLTKHMYDVDIVSKLNDL